MGKKIGIFTFYANNYGANWQAYALQKYIKFNHSEDVEVIYFQTEQHAKNNKVVFTIKSNNPIKQFIINLLTLYRYLSIKKKQKRFEIFRNTNIPFSNERYTTVDEVLTSIKHKDIYITGSDQVFNIENPYYKVYYLGFKKNDSKKVAYAASFGTSTFDDAYTNRIKDFINDFDHLSCREAKGAEYLSKISNNKVAHVVDPVFLLDKKDWLEIAHIPKDDKYIFVYDLNGGYELLDLAYRVKEQTGYKIVCCTNKASKIYKKADKVLFSLGPAEVIGYISNAEYVVTDSFHGTAMALIHDIKTLSYIALPKKSERLTSLMFKLGIEQQVVHREDLNTFNIEDIDFKEYRHRLEKEITISREYLKKALE